MHTYLSYHFGRVQGGKMNIFLLFLTTLFMIGYYMLYSPSQQVTNTGTEDVVKMSDLRAIAECVIGMENAMMNSEGEEYKNTQPCVGRYGVDGDYVCAKDTDGGITKEVLCTEGDPEYNFIVSYSAPLTVDDYGPMLDIIEKYYQDKGTFGIYEDNKLLAPSVSGHIDINPVISGTDSENPRLENGKLVYVMQYKIPYSDAEPVNPDDPEECNPPKILMTTADGESVCVTPDTPVSCDMDGYVLDENGVCVLLEEGECTKLEKICKEQTNNCVKEAIEQGMCTEEAQCLENRICSELIPDCDSMTCRTPGDLECPEGTSPSVYTDENTGETQIECIPNITNDEPTVHCNASQYVFTLQPLQPGATIQSIPRRGRCGPCEKIGGSRYNPETQNWDVLCIPDFTKMARPACNDAEIDDCVPSPTASESCYCHDDNKRLYFGFAADFDPQCLEYAGTEDSVLSSVLLSVNPPQIRDGRWHCMECPNGVDELASVWPYIVVCNP